MPIVFRTNKKGGFTVVELAVVIAVLSIMATMSFLAYTNVQKQARDNQRASSATVVAESLEKYFSQHGEYPSVTKVTTTNAESVRQLLGITNIGSLLAPNTPSGTANVWKSGDANSTNRLTYYGNTDASASCRTLTGTADICEDYRIQYYKEKTNTVETIYSRNKSVAATTPPPPVAPTIDAPAVPTITAALSGSNAVGTRSDTSSCGVGAQLQYAFRWRMNDGAWSSDTTWDGTTTSISTPATQGTKYGFQVKARCLEGDYSSAEAVSTEATYTRLITTPAAPTVTETTSGNISTWTWNATTCPAGTTARYQYRFVADWGYTSVWYGPYTGLYTRTWDTSSQGYEYIIQVQTHCYTPFATSNWSATGQDAYIRPVSPPGPITFAISRAAANEVRVTAAASCGTGVFLYSRADIHTWDYPWSDNGQYGWYATSHGGAWSNNNWGFHGPPAYTGSINLVSSLATGSRWNMAVDLKCRNSTTGRESTSTGRVESAIMNLPA